MANEYLKRTPTSSGNRKVWTWSGWVKRNEISNGSVFYTSQTSTPYLSVASFNADNTIEAVRSENGTVTELSSESVFRDPGSWKHILISFDTTKSTESERTKLYVNGVLSPFDSSANYASLNYEAGVNRIVEHNIGIIRNTSSSLVNPFLGELFDLFLVDGQALTPDVFGFYKDGDGYMSSGTANSTDFKPGQWMPHSPTKIKKDINRRGGFGVNGFYLPMNDSSNPGADFHCAPNSIIKLKGEDLPQPQNGAPTTSDAFVSQLRQEEGTLGFDGCLKLDGNQGLSIADTAALDLGTGDFTIEGFYYLKDEGTYHALFDFRGSGGDGLYPALFKDQTENKLYFYENSGVEIDDISMRHNEWMHVAICRNSGVTRAFVDGKLSGSFNDSNNYISRDLYIGQSLSNSNDLFGFVSNFRIVKGTGLYTANFTAPTEPLTAVTNTILLCANSTTSATASTVTPSTISAIGSPIATRNELTGSVVYALPLISGGKNSGFGDYSNDIRGSGTAKTVSAVTYNSITPTITSGHSPYGSFVDYNSPAGTGGYIDVADSTAFDNVNLTTAEWTFEAWYKRGAVGSGASNLIQFGNTTDYQNISVSIHPSGRLWYIWSYNGSSWGVLDSTGGPVIPQDEWCHIAIVKEATPTPRIVTYVNGVAAKLVEVTSNISYTSPDYMRIGGHYRGPNSGGDTYYYNGGIFDARFYSTVKYKGGFDVPKPYTPVGIEAFRTTADTCKNNFVTMNPLNKNGCTLSNGNLTTADATSNGGQIYSTMGSNTGKWYYEAHVTQEGAAAGTLIGINPLIRPSSNQQNRTAYRSSGDVYSDSSTVQTGTTYTTGDIIGVAWDADNKKLWFAKNGSWVYSGNPAGGTNPAVTYTNTETQGPSIQYDNGGQSQVTNLNFGQNPSFSGQVTAGTNADGNGKGLFKYAPPSGFLALCEDNLPTPAIADPGKHFKSVLYHGDGNSGRSITGVGFQPDLVWIKNRTTATSHGLYDTIRGPEYDLRSDSTAASTKYAGYGVASFDENGFTVQGNGTVSNSDDNFVAWCWKAGGPAVSNTDGTITSQVSANQTAGFSIVSYTGNETDNATVGHGLGKVPDMIIVKNRTSAVSWGVWHSSLTSGQVLRLDQVTQAQTPGTAYFQDENNTSSVFALGTNDETNDSDGDTYIAYCWAEIEGFSKFGSYLGNSSTDGPFVYCGFKPAWVMIKAATELTSYTSYSSWGIKDSSRYPSNINNVPTLWANESYAEGKRGNGGNDTYNEHFDFLSNGFKIGSSSSYEVESNRNGVTYIFMAFAESPFQTANAK